MKKIIDGRKYDTETATLVARVGSRAAAVGDFSYWEADLYVTLNKRWFLAGEGGPMTWWGVSVPGGGTGGSSGIRLVDPEQAQSLLEEAELFDEMEKHFHIEEA
jgi:hypothetical protein